MVIQLLGGKENSTYLTCKEAWFNIYEIQRIQFDIQDSQMRNAYAQRPIQVWLMC